RVRRASNTAGAHLRFWLAEHAHQRHDGMARGRRLGWLRIGHVFWRADAAVSRAVPHSRYTADRAGGPCEWVRRVGRDVERFIRTVDAAVRSGRAASEWH